jgi:hypothetical protein
VSFFDRRKKVSRTSQATNSRSGTISRRLQHGQLGRIVEGISNEIKPNAWNRFDVTAVGDHFRVMLNGDTVLDAKDPKHASGVIGFQCQKDQHIEFRNVKVTPLKPYRSKDRHPSPT